MTKIQKIERENKIIKYMVITIIIVFSLLSIVSIIFSIYQYIKGTIELKQLVSSFMTLFNVPIFVMMWKAYGNREIIMKYVLENEKLKLDIPKQFHLSTDDFVEIVRREGKIDYYYSKRDILRLDDAKLYARLISDDEIEVIVKNNEGKLLHEPQKINNFVYFKEHYKPKE